MNSAGEKKQRLYIDLTIALGVSIVTLVIFHIFDTFEGLYAFSRAYEHLEADELILVLLSMPLPVAWLAYRRFSDAEAEFSKRIKLEKALEQSRRMEAMGTLASGVAHEINNQLVPIITMAELLRDHTDKNNPDHRKLELIFSSASNAKKTVSKILAFSNAGDNQGRTSDAALVCVETEELLKISCPPNVSFSVRLADRLGKVPLAAHDLQSVLVNPVVNAFDALRDRDGDSPGAVVVDVYRSNSNDTNAPNDLTEGSYICIRVADNGPGVPPENIKRVFDPFFTTKPVGSGVGLGMSVVYGLVKGVHGNVVLESKIDQGTICSIFLPKIV